MERYHVIDGYLRLDQGGTVTSYADAQATIEALQAQHKLARDAWWESVKELESQLTQRTAERDTARRRVDELEAREVDVVMLKGELLELREQNRVLREALRVAVFLDGPHTVQPEFERWSALVDEGLKQNFNEWYGVQVLAALTATSQEG